jgi:tRNA (guanine-N7-)-methyltransferase
VGKNKLEKFEALATFKHVVQAPFREVFKNDHPLKGKWGREFFHNNRPIILELGCGKGEYTVGLGRVFVQKNFIGVDIKGHRLFKGAAQALEEGLANVGFIRTNIELIESFFSPDEVDEIWLTFPDPQIKKYRKRLTSTTFLGSYARFLKPGGVVHLKTDSRFMYIYTRELLKINGLEVLADEPDLYGSGIKDEVTGIQTYYESKWLGHGVSIKYLKFKMGPVGKELIEPDVDIEPDGYRSAGQRVVED